MSQRIHTQLIGEVRKDIRKIIAVQRKEKWDNGERQEKKTIKMGTFISILVLIRNEKKILKPKVYVF